jgi:hypothetical protein
MCRCEELAANIILPTYLLPALNPITFTCYLSEHVTPKPKYSRSEIVLILTLLEHDHVVCPLCLRIHCDDVGHLEGVKAHSRPTFCKGDEGTLVSCLLGFFSPEGSFENVPAMAGTTVFDGATA